ncbi:MAG: cytochrome c [Bacteriovoracaceae bacterium]|nr:cytochrome c [Bacteriovoracaceae bacterium]
MKNYFKNISEVGVTPTSFFLFLLILVSCNQQQNPNISQEQQKLIDHGRVVYFANCIACHNQEPKFDGSIGPSLHGSSFELIRLRMLYGKYPDGHKPKRTTTDMPEFEDLKDDIPALHAFLNQ